MRALEAAKESHTVFAEFYTSHLIGATQTQLERALGKRIEFLDRAAVEGGQRILEAAREHRVAFLCAGDPLTATTHQDLRLRAQEAGIPTRVVHGVSIQVAAAGAAGLQSYKFGRTTTIAFPEPNFKPTSPYKTIRDNLKRKLHTLVLLDLRAEENRYMSASEGVRFLLSMEKTLHDGVAPPERLMVACARVGADDERVVYASAKELADLDLGPPLHCLIVPGELHFAEEKALARFRSATAAPSLGKTQRP